jgi:NAD(P)-dependent dehydrogenase (short-subunit alcohol dehydrogenase family)
LTEPGKGLRVRIEGLSALVTGGASGLGFATARLLTERGASVVLVDLPSSAGQDAAERLGPSASLSRRT